MVNFETLLEPNSTL